MTTTQNLTRSIRVAIVDDHQMVRDWTRDALIASDGIEVVGVGDCGHAALQLVSALRPDVLLLDIHLPDISGVEVSRRLRETHPELAILIVTGFDDARYARALLDLGVRGFLTKAASAAEIVEAVRDASQGRTTIHSECVEPAGVRPPESLSSSDRQLLRLVATGMTNEDIATSLGHTLQVVEHRLSKVLQALSVSSRDEAIVKAQALGLVKARSTQSEL